MACPTRPRPRRPEKSSRSLSPGAVNRMSAPRRGEGNPAGRYLNRRTGRTRRACLRGAHIPHPLFPRPGCSAGPAATTAPRSVIAATARSTSATHSSTTTVSPYRAAGTRRRLRRSSGLGWKWPGPCHRPRSRRTGRRPKRRPRPWAPGPAPGDRSDSRPRNRRPARAFVRSRAGRDPNRTWFTLRLTFPGHAPAMRSVTSSPARDRDTQRDTRDGDIAAPPTRRHDVGGTAKPLSPGERRIRRSVPAGAPVAPTPRGRPSGCPARRSAGPLPGSPRGRVSGSSRPRRPERRRRA